MIKKILICGTLTLIGAFLGAMANKKGRELGEEDSGNAESKENL